MELIYYRLFNDDLHRFSNVQLIIHYNNFNRKERRLASRKDFYNKYLEFDINFYKLYFDLGTFNEYQLIEHYYKFGRIEGRIGSAKHFLETYNDFDINFYRYYNDISYLTNDQLYIHYWTYGRKENRIYSQTQFYALYPELLEELANTNTIIPNINYYKYYMNKECSDTSNLSKNILMIEKKKMNLDDLKYYELSYDEFNTYYNLYLKNNFYLFNIVNNYHKKYEFNERLKNIQNYGFMTDNSFDNYSNNNINYILKKYFRIGDENIINKCLYENYNLIFTLNSIINKKIMGYCIKTGKSFECNYIKYYPGDCCIGYYFNFLNGDNNEFIIFFIWEFYAPLIIFYPTLNEVYNISYRYKGTELINNCKLDILPYIYDNIISNNFNVINYHFGIISNSGHYFWNEVIALMILIETKLINNIDNFIIGPCDYLNIAPLLNKKYKKNIIYKSNKSNNIPIINSSKVYIDNSTINTFKKFYEITDEDIIDPNITDKQTIHILFDIRSTSRVCLNESEIIVSLINHIINNYPNYNFKFYISGWYTYENDPNNINITINEQNIIFNNIVDKIKSTVNKPNIHIESLIGQNLSSIIKTCSIIDFCITNAGSGIGFFLYLIYKTLMITYSNTHCYDFISQQFAFESLPLIIPVKNEYIKDCLIGRHSDFTVDSNEIIRLFTSNFNKIIDKKNNHNNLNNLNNPTTSTYLSITNCYTGLDNNYSLEKISEIESINYFKNDNSYELNQFYDSYFENEHSNELFIDCNKYNNIQKYELINNIISSNQISYNFIKLNVYVLKNYITQKTKLSQNSLEFGTNEMLNIYKTQFIYSDIPFYIYWCNEENPFCLIQNGVYSNFDYIVYYNENKIYKINFGSNGYEYKLNDIIKYLDPILNPLTNTVNINDKYVYFGFLSNIGHHLWNEVSGLYNLLQYKHLYDKITGIIIGPYDFFNIKQFLIENYSASIKIIDYANYNDFIKNNINTNNIFNNISISLDHLPLCLNTYYINKNIKKFFYFNQINQINNTNTTNTLLNIVIDIRTSNRVLLNYTKFIVDLITNIYNDYSDRKITIFFTGRFLTNISNINLETDNEYIEQIKIVNEVVEQLKIIPNFNYINLIGKNIFDIFPLIIDCHLCITTFGTSVSNLLNWIYDNKILSFAPKKCYEWLDMAYCILKKFSCITVPIEYINSDINCVHDNFLVEFDKYYEFFKKVINSIIYFDDLAK
jgi:hypothetical protein